MEKSIVTNQRQSNIELLRCFAMLCIIVYHMLVSPMSSLFPNVQLYKAIQMPLHIGVPLFVLISGYFGIRFSLRGLMRFLAKVYVYLMPFMLLEVCLSGNAGEKNILKAFWVFGYGFDGHWYINVYLYLFLFSPVINRYLDDISLKQRLFLLGILAYMSVYVGNVTGEEWHLADGKNLTNFLLLYVIGNTIRSYQNQNQLTKWKLIFLIAIFNSVVVLAYLHIPSLTTLIWKCGFAYNSPLLLLNSVLVFLLFCQFHFSSKIVNWFGGGIFACYLWQCVFIVRNAIFEQPIRQISLFIGGQIIL